MNTPDVKKISIDLVSRLRSAEKSGEPGRFRVVVMNDFSFDRLVHVDDFDQFVGMAGEVLAHKGGLLPRSRQTIRQGGCSANTATTLARLGVQTFFITKTDELGMYLLDFYLKRAGVDISHAKTGGTLALMTCLEVGSEKYNVMINDGDSFGAFSFDDLDSADLELIASADLVGVFDWCLNRTGTDLAGRLFSHLDGTDIATYLDTSDPAPRKKEIPELFECVLLNPGLKYLNLNENELRQFTGSPEAGESLETLVDLSRMLRNRVPSVLSVHTSCFALSVDETVAYVPTYRVMPRRTTGAGDTWNGGNILGILLGLSPEQRLLLANAVAGSFIESRDALRPTLSDAVTFIENRETEMHEIPLCGED